MPRFTMMLGDVVEACSGVQPQRVEGYSVRRVPRRGIIAGVGVADAIHLEPMSLTGVAVHGALNHTVQFVE